MLRMDQSPYRLRERASNRVCRIALLPMLERAVALPTGRARPSVLDRVRLGIDKFVLAFEYVSR
jgi:hypothetical protein